VTTSQAGRLGLYLRLGSSTSQGSVCQQPARSLSPTQGVHFSQLSNFPEGRGRLDLPFKFPSPGIGPAAAVPDAAGGRGPNPPGPPLRRHRPSRSAHGPISGVMGLDQEPDLGAISLDTHTSPPSGEVVTPPPGGCRGEGYGKLSGGSCLTKVTFPGYRGFRGFSMHQFQVCCISVNPFPD